MLKGHEEKNTFASPPLLGIFAVFFLMSALIVSAGYAFYRGQAISIKGQQSEMIAAIANLKVRQITAWRNERLADASMIQKNVPLFNLVHQYTGQSWSAGQGTAILSYMRSMADSYGYESLLLLDLNMRVRLATGNETPFVGKKTARLAERVLQTGEIFVSDLRWGEVKRVIRLDVYIPLYLHPDRKSEPIGVMILRTEPHRAFYPLVQSWPTPSPTAESLLVRREGDKVLFLNELRHKKDTALQFTLPVTKDQSPACAAVRGFQGVMEGIDYRSVSVLAAVYPVSGMNMFIVSKIDTEEVYAPLRRQFRMILALIILSICFAGALLGFLWRKREADSYRICYETERQRQFLLKRYEILTQNANEIILMMDDSWKIVEVNQWTLQTYGYRREEMIGMNLRELRDPASLESVDQEIAAFDRRDNILFETRHRCKNGNVIHVEISASKLVMEEKTYFLEIARDITERKKKDNELKELVAKLQKALEEIKTLRGIVPICANCKKIRDDEGYWQHVESYVTQHSEAQFSHGICPDCLKKLYPDFYKDIDGSLT